MAAESNRTARTIAIRRGIGLTAFVVMLTAGLTSGRAPGLAPGFGPATVHAQLQARHIDVTGSVKDPHGDSIVAAKIVLLRADRPGGSLVGETTSDDSGRCRFSGLGEGAYTLTVSSDGFSPAEEALTLRAGLSPPSLSIGGGSLSRRLKTEIDATPLGNVMVPGLILQPIVENAIKHGIARNLSCGSITIRFERDERDLSATRRRVPPI